MKVCYKKSEQIYKSFYHIVFLESFQLMPKGLEAKKKYYVGGMTSKDFKKKRDGNLRDMKSKYWDFLLEEHCKKLFYMMNYFWEAIVDVDVDISWLVTVEWNRGTIDQFSAKVVNKLKLSGMVYESTRNVKPPGGKKITGQNIEF